MVLTRLSHSGGACPLGRTNPSSCHDASAPGPSATSSSSRPSLHILDLPVELVERIMSYLSYKEVSHARSVCKKLDSVASNLLTKSFYSLQSENFQLLQSMRSQMPRRESLRRKHPLANQCDIIETINMRFDLLQMTFGKHMERKFICFFPGEILDEVVRVSRMACTHSSVGERLTDELCDLSTMAMEYFRERLDAGLRSSLLYQRSTAGATGADSTICTGSPGPGSTCASSVVDSSVAEDSDLLLDWNEGGELSYNQLAAVNNKLAKLNKSVKKNSMQMAMLRRELRSHRQRCQQQSRVIAEYAARIEEHDTKLDETSLKFSTVLQDLSECRRQLSQWRDTCSQRCTSVASMAGNSTAAAAAAASTDTDGVSTDTEATEARQSASVPCCSRRGKRKFSDGESGGAGGGARSHRPTKLRRTTSKH